LIEESLPLVVIFLAMRKSFQWTGYTPVGHQ
jgi:hypothetical protein